MTSASFIQREQQCGKLRKTVALSVSSKKKAMIYPWAHCVVLIAFVVTMKTIRSHDICIAREILTSRMQSLDSI